MFNAIFGLMAFIMLGFITLGLLGKLLRSKLDDLWPDNTRIVSKVDEKEIVSLRAKFEKNRYRILSRLPDEKSIKLLSLLRELDEEKEFQALHQSLSQEVFQYQDGYALQSIPYGDSNFETLFRHKKNPKKKVDKLELQNLLIEAVSVRKLLTKDKIVAGMVLMFFIPVFALMLFLWADIEFGSGKTSNSSFKNNESKNNNSSIWFRDNPCNSNATFDVFENGAGQWRNDDGKFCSK